MRSGYVPAPTLNDFSHTRHFGNVGQVSRPQVDIQVLFLLSLLVGIVCVILFVPAAPKLSALYDGACSLCSHLPQVELQVLRRVLDVRQVHIKVVQRQGTARLVVQHSVQRQPARNRHRGPTRLFLELAFRARVPSLLVQFAGILVHILPLWFPVPQLHPRRYRHGADAAPAVLAEVAAGDAFTPAQSVQYSTETFGPGGGGACRRDEALFCCNEIRKSVGKTRLQRRPSGKLYEEHGRSRYASASRSCCYK